MHSLLLYIQETSSTNDSYASTINEETITFFDLMVEGGILMIPILILLLISFYVIIERWSAISRSHTDTNRFLQSIGSLLKTGKQSNALAYCHRYVFCFCDCPTFCSRNIHLYSKICYK